MASYIKEPVLAVAIAVRARLLERSYREELSEFLDAIALGKPRAATDEFESTRSYVLKNVPELANSERLINPSQDTVANTTKKKPTAAGESVPSVLELAGFLAFSDVFELLAWQYDIDPATSQPISVDLLIPDLYRLILDQLVSSVTEPNDTQETQVFEVTAEEIQTARQNILQLSATALDELAEKMRSEARRLNVLSSDPHLTPTEIWPSEFDPNNPSDRMLQFFTLADRITLSNVFDAFASIFKKQGIDKNFTTVYNALDTDSSRAILALSAYMVPRQRSYGWPVDRQMIDVSSFFFGNNAQMTLLEIQKLDSTLSGKQLTLTLPFM